MAELTPLDEKLAEVLGLAQAAQQATTHVAGMEDAEHFRELLVEWSQFSHGAELPSRAPASIKPLFEPGDGVPRLVALLACALEHALR